MSKRDFFGEFVLTDLVLIAIFKFVDSLIGLR